MCIRDRLGSPSRFGLIEDLCGHTALLVALRAERKPIVHMLLRKIAKRSCVLAARGEQMLALGQFMRHRVELARKYPDLFLEFLSELSLVRETHLAPEGRNIALLPSATDFVTMGSHECMPGPTFWEVRASRAAAGGVCRNFQY